MYFTIKHLFGKPGLFLLDKFLKDDKVFPSPLPESKDERLTQKPPYDREVFMDSTHQSSAPKKPNILFVFADQLRAQACSILNQGPVPTPALGRLASEGVTFTTAVSNCPVCTPYRASLLTGQYPLTNGLFINDVQLSPHAVSIGKVLKGEGYQTAYIGKWHLDGPNRRKFTPPGPRRQGFDFWAVGNCTHDYFHSVYYRDEPEPLFCEGYDAIAQTELARKWMREHHDSNSPFCLFLSWGPPHNPYRQVPEKYLQESTARSYRCRPNCPAPNEQDILGYYAHVAALDDCLGGLLDELDELGLKDDTIVVFTSDHGDMLGSQGVERKQWPWDESILVPFVLRYPQLGNAPRTVPNPFGCVDVMPTLLKLARQDIPHTVQGVDFSPLLRGESCSLPESALIVSIAPFSENQGPAWRGIRTERYTYVSTLEGPWLLYDNEDDPYQMKNLISEPSASDLLERLNNQLQAHLESTGDEFLTPEEYRQQYGISVRENGAVPHNSLLEEQ